jgi:hypothetical protein
VGPLASVAVSFVVPALGIAALPVARRFRLDGATEMALAGALSFAWVQLGAIALLAVGQLTALTVSGWIAGGALGSLALGPVRPARPPIFPALATAALLLVYLAVAAVPAWQPDDMTYHLALARQFAEAHRFVQPDDNIFASLPLGWEAIESALHAFGPPFEGRLLSVCATLWAGIATVGLAREAGARGAAWCAPALLAIPTMLEVGSSAYVEGWLLLLVALALRFALAGSLWAAFFVGLALQVKYTAVALFVFVLLILLMDVLRREDEMARARRIPLFLVVAAVIGAPFFVRNWIERGNPVFPTAFEMFGGRGWDSWRAWAYAQINSQYGMGHSARDWALLPFRLFTTRDLDQAFEGALGPVLGIGALVGMLRARTRPRFLLVAFVVLWSAFWAVTTQQLRFFMPALPALLALAADTRWMVPALALHLVWAAPTLREIVGRQHTRAFWDGTLDRDALLTRMLPENYPLSQAVDRLVPPGEKVWLVWMRAYTYYFPRDFRVDCVFESWRFDELIDQAPTVDDIPQRLLAEGFRYVLVNDRFMITEKGKEMYEGRTKRIVDRYEEAVARGYLKTLYEWQSVKLYEVMPPASAVERQTLGTP